MVSLCLADLGQLMPMLMRATHGFAVSRVELLSVNHEGDLHLFLSLVF
jgi:hypothetical protein